VSETQKIEPDMYLYERWYKEKGYTLICGVDEAGRGPLAGPVYAAAVILDEERPIEGIKDSKKLTHKKREELFEKITANAKGYAIVAVGEKTIDRINILKATLLAMRKAVESLKVAPQVALVDGNIAPGLDKEKTETVCIIKGDAASASVAAASILAKVSRDRFMVALEEQYPGYGFAQHKGYGTKLHYEKIRQLGVSAVHRRSFLRNLEIKHGEAT